MNTGEPTGSVAKRLLDDSADWPDEQELQAALLTVLWPTRDEWQHRLVYRIHLSTTTHARVEAAYQVLIRGQHLISVGAPEGGVTVRVLLPITWRPKELLLNCRLTTSSENAAHLLTRVDTAGLAAGYFLESLRTTDVVVHSTPEAIRDLVESVARFMPRRVRAIADLNEDSPAEQLAERLRDPSLLAKFLSFSAGPKITGEQVAAWALQLRHAEGLVSEALEAPAATPENSATNLLLALSELPTSDLSTMQTAVDTYIELVMALQACGERELLDLLGRLGRDWMVIIETDYELDRPLTVTMSDDRPLRGVDGADHVFRVPVPLADGGSLHVETQLSDPAAALKDVKLLGPGDSQLPLSDDVRETHDRHAVYVSGRGRPSAGVAQIQVTLTREISRTNTVVMGLAVSACFFAALVDNEADIMALLVIPATLAVSVVQVRETSSVVRRLTARTRTRLFIAASLLWLIAALRSLVQNPGEPGMLRLLIDLVQGGA